MIQLQINNRTFVGRYLTEHRILRRYFPTDNIRILSFGCSTGEELIGLRALFPLAEIFGCDIDWSCLQVARSLLGNKAIIFASSETEITRNGPYDIVIVNSVLLRPSTFTGGRKIGIATSAWEESISLLDSALKPGGVLQIINSNIPFRYHPQAKNYATLNSPLILGPNFVDQFAPDGKHLATAKTGVGLSAVLSWHLGEEGMIELLPTDLYDVHFQKSGGIQLSGIKDEIMPSITPKGTWAEGEMTYRPKLDSRERRAAAYPEIHISWESLSADQIRVHRNVRRIWFNRSVIAEEYSVIDMAGPVATTFIEASCGVPSTRLVLAGLMGQPPVYSPSF